MAILLMFSCVAGAIPAQAAEIDYTCGENLTWSIDVDNEPLLAKLILPDSLICIQRAGVYYCRNLEELDISNVQYMYTSAWSELPFETLTIPASLRWAGHSAFSLGSETKQIIFEDQAAITEISDSIVYGASSQINVNHIHNSVRSIGDAAFGGCTGLESITIPGSVNYVGANAFRGLTPLQTIYAAGSPGRDSHWSEGCTAEIEKAGTQTTTAPETTTQKDRWLGIFG